MKSLPSQRVPPILAQGKKNLLWYEGMMYPRMSLDEFAQRLDESIERVREWREAGLIDAVSSGTAGHEDLERGRLLQGLLARGFSVEVIARSLRSGELASRVEEFLAARFPGEGRPARRLAEVVDEIGLAPDVAERVWRAAAGGRVDDIVNTDDHRFLTTVRVVLDAGVPEEALLQLVQVWGDSLGRAAEAATRLMHFYVHEAAGPGGSRPGADVARDLVPLLEPTVLYFLRRRYVESFPGDMALHLAEEAGERGASGVVGQIDAAIVFVDLASFTPLTEAMGDAEAAHVLQRFAALVRDAAGRASGQIVKQIGDAFMMLFHNPRSAIGCALDIENGAATELRFPAVRVGVHWGPVLYREGDYVGSTVNVASRVAGAADRHDVLVTAAVRSAVGAVAEWDFAPLPRRRLKGVADDVELFAVRRHGAVRPGLAIDPVCGMELHPPDIVARLAVGGTDHAFCSAACWRLFEAAPGHYVGRKE